MKLKLNFLKNITKRANDNEVILVKEKSIKIL